MCARKHSSESSGNINTNLGQSELNRTPSLFYCLCVAAQQGNNSCGYQKEEFYNVGKHPSESPPIIFLHKWGFLFPITYIGSTLGAGVFTVSMDKYFTVYVGIWVMWERDICWCYLSSRLLVIGLDLKNASSFFMIYIKTQICALYIS